MNARVVLSRAISGYLIAPVYFTIAFAVMNPFVEILLIIAMAFSVIILPPFMSIFLYLVRPNSINSLAIEFAFAGAFGVMMFEALSKLLQTAMTNIFAGIVIICVMISIANLLGALAVELLIAEEETDFAEIIHIV